MTSLRQIEANRLNSLRSTGPKTDEGKLRSRGNAVRHGLTAETVIAGLEDREDYEAFQECVVSDYEATSAVERELVLRLASVLWRLRRSTAIEAVLFEPATPQRRPEDVGATTASFLEQTSSNVAENFLRLNDSPTRPLDRLSRYEQRLWRQARQIVSTLKSLRPIRPTPRQRTSLFTMRDLG